MIHTLYFKRLKKTVLFLITCVVINTTSAQILSKTEDTTSATNNKAVSEAGSTAKSFTPARMTKAERDAISSSSEGLQVWCSDCNISTNPPSGEFCVYLGTAWTPFMMLTASGLTTAKRTDPINKPVRISASSVIIKGTLVRTLGVLPTETGVVWRKVAGNDFATLPVLDEAGNAIAPDYKTATETAVTTEGGIISVTISGLTSAKRPYIFRTYAKSPSGIGYGNPVIFNLVSPTISDPVVTNENSLFPVFEGTLNINAGTPAGTITEYGYYSGADNPPTANKKVISGVAAIAALNAGLNSDNFTADPTVDFTVKDYNVIASGITYFRYYAVVNGETIYSNVVSFNPPDLITGGDAVAAVVSVGTISNPLKIDDASNSSIVVTFDVTKPGDYKFEPILISGATTGVTIPSVNGNFAATGIQSVTFSFSGTPETSLEGNTFEITKLGKLSTGEIQIGDMKGYAATCDPLHTTKIVDVISLTGKTWMDRNLGASDVLSNFGTEAVYNSYGCMFQWGRGNDGHASVTWGVPATMTPANGTTTETSSLDNPGHNKFILQKNWPQDWRSSQNNELWQGVNGINNPCPKGYRVPAEEELAAEYKVYGINGKTKTGFDSVLKIPAAGIRDPQYGTKSIMNDFCMLWSGTPSVTNAYYRAGDWPKREATSRATGMPVRCIKN